jgi:hypothetical protein
MKYLDLLLALDVLSRYYPKYYSSEFLQLAEDVFKWLNNELPEDSSKLIYLKSCFDNPTDALKISILSERWKLFELAASCTLQASRNVVSTDINFSND